MATLLSPLLDLLTLQGTVTETEPVTARFRRLRIEGEALSGLTVRPGQQVRVMVGDGLTLRTYSIWRYDPEGAVELRVLDHAGAGPGARWASAAAVGDRVRIRKPEGTFVLRPDATHHVFVGEETASVAFGAMLGALPDGARISGCVETETAADRLALPYADRLDWVTRGGTSLPDAVRRLAPEPGGMAYVAGEARTVQHVRQVLVREAGWDRRAVLTKPFWAPGKRGLE
ncbi:NADPH-dependent ferric siderophore reductase [Streptomyces sp. B3I7]|uniref:siderophore-interacting protein n=1 Tax=unclassified Streptomyces TaxID=2593676 RepID=UPI00278A9E63|nr:MULTISPECIES: siderophore-interacting protein [unclassified Streptomyces]MDQ0789338.1 NADPH-dependent ferric siderophore reductase [Streptomyces sp. B3I8]MDQ0811050.1 NADPH-dependent ferric siderophore reductase [Streptomyces sp. B3I7]